MVVGGFSSSAVERRQNRAPGSPEVRVGGPLKLREKEERGGAERDSIPPPPPAPPLRKSLEESRSVSAPCLPVGGWGFFFPFIHVPFFPPPPPPLKQASRSVNVLRALGQVKPVGFFEAERRMR